MSKSRPRARERIQGPHLKQRDGVYYACLGKRKRKSLYTRDRAEAEKRFAELLGRAPLELRRAAGAKEVALNVMTEQYLAAPHGWTKQTLRTARSRVELVGHWFETSGAEYASQITPQMLDEMIASRRKEATHRTINRDLRAWKLALAWGAERGMCPPCKPVADREYLREAKRSQRRVLPSPDEVARVIAALQRRDDTEGARVGHRGGGAGPRTRCSARAVRVLYATGLRIDELRRLALGDLHDGALWVRPEQGAADEAEPTKGHRERSIPLSEEARQVVRDYLAWSEGRTRVFSESWLLGVVADACKAVGVPVFGLHDLRRAFATEAHRAGVPVLVLSRWLGHADVRTTELYLGSYRTDRDVIAPLPRGLQRAEGKVRELSTR